MKNSIKIVFTFFLLTLAGYTNEHHRPGIQCML